MLFRHGSRADGAQDGGVGVNGGKLAGQVVDIEAVLFVHFDDEGLNLRGCAECRRCIGGGLAGSGFRARFAGCFGRMAGVAREWP